MEPSVDAILAELDRMFVEQFEVDPEAVVPEARLKEDLDLDSLDAADMLIAIERRFDVRLEDEVARSFKTVGDIHRYVRSLVEARAVAGAAGEPPAMETGADAAQMS